MTGSPAAGSPPRTHDLLVVRRGGLGDTLLMVPVVRALRRRWPNGRVHFAGVLEFAAVLRDHGVCDVALSSEDLQLWALAVGGPTGDRVRERLCRHACIVADEPLALPQPGPLMVPFDVRRAEAGVPFARQIARQLQLELRWPEDAWLMQRGSPTPDACIALAPGSGGRRKCWPRACWLELAASFAARGDGLCVVIGPVETEGDDARRWPWPEGTDLVAGLSASQLGRRLRSCRAFVGNDSGPTHLAAMLGVPTLALFGPTDPSVWAPVGPQVRTLMAPGGVLGDLAAPAVLAACDGW